MSVSLFWRLAIFLKRDSSTGVCIEFCKISRNTFFIIHCDCFKTKLPQSIHLFLLISDKLLELICFLRYLELGDRNIYSRSTLLSRNKEYLIILTWNRKISKWWENIQNKSSENFQKNSKNHSYWPKPFSETNYIRLWIQLDKVKKRKDDLYSIRFTIYV